MTYANDVIEIQDRARRRTLKPIARHSDAELDAAVEAASRMFGRGHLDRPRDPCGAQRRSVAPIAYGCGVRVAEGPR